MGGFALLACCECVLTLYVSGLVLASAKSYSSCVTVNNRLCDGEQQSAPQLCTTPANQPWRHGMGCVTELSGDQYVILGVAS
jgi:hypothetical protein